MAASNRGIVGSDLGSGGTVRTKIQQTSSFVGTGANDLGSVLRKKETMVNFEGEQNGGRINSLETNSSSRLELHAQTMPCLHSDRRL